MNIYKKTFTLVCKRLEKQITMTWLTARSEGETAPEGMEHVGCADLTTLHIAFKRDFSLDVRGFSQRLIEAMRSRSGQIPTQMLRGQAQTTHSAQTQIFVSAQEETDAARCALSNGYRPLRFLAGDASSWPAMMEHISSGEGKYMVTGFKYVE